MIKKIIYLLFLKTAILLCLTSISAQSNGSNGTSRAFSPFRIGETLIYEGKISKAILRGISVADLKFSVVQAPNGKDYILKSEAKSKGTLARLFRFSFLQLIESSVAGDKLRILKTTKHDEQGDRIRKSEAVFDYSDKRVTYTETNPADDMRPPRRIASAITEEDTQDMISGIYSLRRMPLEIGQTFQLSISDSGLVYKIPVRVTAREQQNSILGKLWCFRLEPQAFGPNRILEQKGSMIIWITDDTQRIPVRAQIQTDGYKIEVKLKKITTQSS